MREEEPDAVGVFVFGSYAIEAQLARRGEPAAWSLRFAVEAPAVAALETAPAGWRRDLQALLGLEPAEDARVRDDDGTLERHLGFA